MIELITLEDLSEVLGTPCIAEEEDLVADLLLVAVVQVQAEVVILAVDPAAMVAGEVILAVDSAVELLAVADLVMV